MKLGLVHKYGQLFTPQRFELMQSARKNYSESLARWTLALQKPDITAADGVSVTGVGGFPSLFFGTSAAAPHAAAIAALIKGANPALTQAQIRSALTNNAIDIEGPGTDRDSGAGIVMPYAALQSLGSPVQGKAFLEFSTTAKTETCCNGDGFIDPGESGTLNVTLLNTGLLDATAATATLSSPTTGVTILNGTSGYPTIAATSGAAANATPFTFSLGASMPVNPRVDFVLTVNYTGGHQAAQTFNFTVQLGHQLAAMELHFNPGLLVSRAREDSPHTRLPRRRRRMDCGSPGMDLMAVAQWNSGCIRM